MIARDLETDDVGSLFVSSAWHVLQTLGPSFGLILGRMWHSGGHSQPVTPMKLAYEHRSANGDTYVDTRGKVRQGDSYKDNPPSENGAKL